MTTTDDKNHQQDNNANILFIGGTISSVIMAANLSKADGLTPIVTFVSMIVLGIVISEYVIENQQYQLTIILFSFVIGIVIAALELRAIMHRRKMEKAYEKRPKLTQLEAKNKLARFVADLFDEDIPFDELENNDETDESTL